MKILVTGATGFIGSHVVRRLLAAGHGVRVLARASSDTSGLPHEAEVTRGELASAHEACDGIDGLVHLAGISGSMLRRGDPGRELRKTNVEDTALLFEAARRGGAHRAVLVTSMWTMLAPQLAEVSPYVRSRVDAETAVLASGLSTVILCPSFVVGAGDRGPNFPGAIVRAFARGKLPMVPPGGSMWISVQDVASAIGAAIERGAQGRRYILGAEYRSYVEVGAVAAAAAGRRMPGWTLPRAAASAIGRTADLMLWVAGRGAPIPLGPGVNLLCQRTAVDCSEHWTDLGQPQVAVLDAVRESVTWFQAHGHL
jgi:dihydroflavonol-4-reductase